MQAYFLRGERGTSLGVCNVENLAHSIICQKSNIELLHYQQTKPQ